jgi:tryptophan aminotransferase
MFLVHTDITGGIDGFLTHSHSVALFYANRRNIFEAIAHKYLDGLATWVSPVAGMFLWIDLAPAGIHDSYDLIRREAFEKGVLAVPGFAWVFLSCMGPGTES